MNEPLKSIWTYHLMNHAQMDVAPGSETHAGHLIQHMQWMLDKVST
jgi:hypothetical protein